MTDLIKEAETDPIDGKFKEKFDKYLIIHKSEKQESSYTIKISDDVINQQLRYTGLSLAGVDFTTHGRLVFTKM